ncbi:MAG: InlB B-repeat-containing protein [Eubacteriaceae bacterium]|nr:InlB B-repeat-containing protein [Eubacteriaceae bacterium]
MWPLKAAQASSGSKLVLNVDVESAVFVYDGQEHSISSFTSNASDYSNTTVEWDISISRVDAGSVSTDSLAPLLRVYQNGEDITEFFRIYISHGTLTIKKLPISISCSAAPSEYSGSQQSAEMQYRQPDAMIRGDQVQGKLIASGKNAGSYTPDANSLWIYSASRKADVTHNYDISVNGSFSIEPTSTVILIEPEAKSSIYGDRDAALTAKVLGALGNDASSAGYTLERSPGSNAGTYEIRVSRIDAQSLPLKNYKNIETRKAEYTIQTAISYRYKGSQPSGAPSLPAKTGASAGQSVSVKPSLSLSGYTFSGWSSPSVSVSGSRFTVPKGINEIVFEGRFSSRTYTISYFVDGELYKQEHYEQDSEVAILQEPSREGATFSGWDSVPVKMPGEDIEVRGTFTKIKYTIGYYINAVVYEIQSYCAGDLVTAPDISLLDGFQGWTGIPDVMPPENLSLYALYAESSSSSTPVRTTAWSPINAVLALAAIALCAAYNFGFIGKEYPRTVLLRSLGILSCLSTAVITVLSGIGASRLSFVDQWSPVCALAVAIQAFIPLRLGKKVFVDVFIDADSGEMIPEADIISLKPKQG